MPDSDHTPKPANRPMDPGGVMSGPGLAPHPPPPAIRSDQIRPPSMRACERHLRFYASPCVLFHCGECHGVHSFLHSLAHAIQLPPVASAHDGMVGWAWRARYVATRYHPCVRAHAASRVRCGLLSAVCWCVVGPGDGKSQV